MKLYELSNQIRDLAFIEDSEQVQLALQELTESFDNKALNIAKLTKEISAEVDAIDNEVKRLNDRKKSLQNKIEWFKSYLLHNMTESSIPQIKDSIITVSVRTNPPSCDIEDVMKLQEDYRKISWVADKTKILEYFKSTGEVIDGAKIITDKKRIDIR